MGERRQLALATHDADVCEQPQPHPAHSSARRRCSVRSDRPEPDDVSQHAAGTRKPRRDDWAEAMNRSQSPAASHQSTAAPLISVVIATKNREALLADTLGALAGQRWPGDQFEVLVADNGSTDGTRAVVERASIRSPMPRIRYRYVQLPGKSSAVNAILDGVRGSLVALTDDDVCPEPDWLERLAAAFEETGADFVAGRILPRWECEPPSWLSSPLYGVLAIPDNGSVRLTLAPEAERDASHGRRPRVLSPDASSRLPGRV